MTAIQNAGGDAAIPPAIATADGDYVDIVYVMPQQEKDAARDPQGNILPVGEVRIGPKNWAETNLGVTDLTLHAYDLPKESIALADVQESQKPMVCEIRCDISQHSFSFQKAGDSRKHTIRLTSGNLGMADMTKLALAVSDQIIASKDKDGQDMWNDFKAALKDLSTKVKVRDFVRYDPDKVSEMELL